MSQHLPPLPQSPARPRPATGDVRIDSRQLLAGARELLIQHGDQTYRLRHTRNDKLILVK